MKKNKNKNSRNGMIELLRFLFCIAVIIFHINLLILGQPIYGKGVHLELFPYGFFGVEFFFIISGIFFVQSIDKTRRKSEEDDVVKKELDYLKNKIKKIFPQHAMAFLIIFIILIITRHFGIVKSIKLLLESIPNFFLLDFTGISITTINSFEWYISAMLIVFAITYPIIYKKYDYFVKIYAPIICMFLYGFLLQNYGTITRTKVWNGFVFAGLIRAFADILLGVSLYELIKWLSKYEISHIKRLLITFIEIGCYIVTFILMQLTLAGHYTIIMLFFLIIGIVITCSESSYTSFIRGRFFEFLGKLSLSMYLIQLAGIRIVQVYFNECSKFEIIGLVLLITIAFSLVLMFLEKQYNILRNRGSIYGKK